MGSFRLTAAKAFCLSTGDDLACSGVEDEELKRLQMIDKRLRRRMRICKHFTRWSCRSRTYYSSLVHRRRANLQAMLQMVDNEIEELEARKSICSLLLETDDQWILEVQHPIDMSKF